MQGWVGGQGTGTEIFAITLLPDGSQSMSLDQYKVDILQAMGAFETTTINDFSALGQNNQQFKALNVPDTTKDLLFSGYHQFADGSTNDTTGNSVSASTNGVGVLNNSMDDGDTLRIDFVNNVTVGIGNNNVYNYATPGHYDIQNFQFAIVQVNGSPPPNSIEVWVRVYNANDDDPAGTSTPAHSAALAGDPQEAITGISINGVALTAAQFAALPKDAALGVLVSGLNLHDTVQVTNSGGYNRIEIENAINFPALGNPDLNGESFDIGGFSFVTTTTTVPSVDLSFDLGLTDADGDTVVSPDAITVELQAPSVPTVVVAIADALLNDNDNTSTVTFTFSQAPTGFTADDITAVGGTVTGLAGRAPATPPPSPRPMASPASVRFRS